MWILKVLSGQQKDQTFEFKPGSYTIGRSNSCDVILTSDGISKQHAQLVVSPVGSFIKDLGSRNGVFVNGVKVLEKQLQPGEQITLHDVFLKLEVQDRILSMTSFPSQGNLAYAQNLEENFPNSFENKEVHRDHRKQFAGFVQRCQEYIESVVLPGVYKLPELFNFKWVIGFLLFCFVIFVTSLSSIPLVRILKTSIEQESQRRAMTIAKTLTFANLDVVAQGVFSSLSVDFALKEPGVRQAYIINSLDGSVLAPVKSLGTFPDLPFVHEARQEGKEALKQVDNNTIVAVSPITVFDSDKGFPTAKALSVVVYNMGILAVGDKRKVSLFIQTFFIALLVGSLLFFFIWKLVEKPFSSLNSQMDEALKSDTALLISSYRFPIFQSFIENVNNALNRMRHGQESYEKERFVEQDRSQEMKNIVELIGFPSMTLRAGDLTVLSLNSNFEELLGMTSADLLYKSLDQFPDQSLKLALKDLTTQADINPGDLCSQPMEFSGSEYEVILQAVYGSQEIAYYLTVIAPKEEEEESYE